ncbi:MAG: Asp-tRNA(Asn)/Glu-tRNA(Gln) amidotransferase subunit GatC [Patescibacteria group bacterium]|nr:Asp-tRNA(Asn)/Glu-tRNA(Gln) amidotransferase subunit GatC [Patescibacteria group bacterium]
MISAKEVKKIARLSYIKLNEREVEKFSKELSGIVDFFQVLKKIETEKVEPMMGTTELTDVLRQDKAKVCPRANELVKRAPENKDNYFKTKPILER